MIKLLKQWGMRSAVRADISNINDKGQFCLILKFAYFPYRSEYLTVFPKEYNNGTERWKPRALLAIRWLFDIRPPPLETGMQPSLSRTITVSIILIIIVVYSHTRTVFATIVVYGRVRDVADRLLHNAPRRWRARQNVSSSPPLTAREPPVARHAGFPWDRTRT